MSDTITVQEKNTYEKGNMVVGSPAKSLILFALPMIVGNIFQQLYNIADSVIVGKFVGDKALAAVGASNAITNLFVMIAIGTGIGCSVVISQFFGAGKHKEMKTAISTAMISVFILSAVLSILGLIFNERFLRLMGTPADVFEDACLYLGIYFMGFVFLFMYNISNSIFNALGDSKKPLIFLIMSSVLNVFLDYWFVTSFHMGVAGVAWATLIAQGVSAVVSMIVLFFKVRGIHSDHYRKFDLAFLRKMTGMAIPSVLQQSVVSIGMLLVQGVVNTFGSDFLAGYTAAIKIDGIAIVPMVNVGNAVSTFVAQNMGAGKIERVKKGLRTGLAMAVAIGIGVGIVVHLCAYPIIGLFMNEQSSLAAADVGANYLQTISFFYFVMGLMNVTAAVLRGAGDKNWFLAQTAINLAVRVILIYVLAQITGGSVIMWAPGVGWVIGFLISMGRYLQGGWKKIRLV